MMIQQQTYGGLLKVRVFNLDVPEREKVLKI